MNKDEKSNILVFGTGLFFDRRKHMLPSDVNILAFLDNDKLLQEGYKDGIAIYEPRKVKELTFDVIVIASSKSKEMYEQLLGMNVSTDKIMFWNEYIASLSHGIIKKFIVTKKRINRNVLITVPSIDLGGGFMTAFYVGQALNLDDYVVTIVTPNNVQSHIVEEINKNGINVIICPSFPYVEKEEISWMEDYDIFWMNSLSTMLVVDRISKARKVIWWLHENGSDYEEILFQYERYVENKIFENVKIYAVSSIAKKNFLLRYQGANVMLLPLGIPDFYRSNNKESKKIIISVVGGITERKNQIEFIQAFCSLPQNIINEAECWIIGREGGKKYREAFNKIIEGKDYIKICGELKREEIIKAFESINVLVCSSKEETFSIAVLEGMMNRKICITNTNTGIEEYIQDGFNGYVYENGNTAELACKLKYVLENYAKLDKIGYNARKTYEERLSFDVLHKRIKNVLMNY